MGRNPENIFVRLRKYVDKSNGPNSCWNWVGCLRDNNQPQGYGQIQYKGDPIGPHRIAWMEVNGDIPDGLFVLHSCDNRLCCNPLHLFLGTQKDNIEDAVSKDRMYKPKGELNHECKITSEEVLEIRELVKDGKLRYKEIAAKFGIHSNHVGAIARREKWKHI